MTDATILDQLEEVRQTGRVNMMDSRGVQRVANDMEFYALVVFVEDASGSEYVTALREMGERRATT